MTQMQTYAMYALAGAGVLLLLLWLVVRVRSRRRAAVRAEIETRIAVETKVQQDTAVKANMDKVLGRYALYRREMAQRELDRYYGKRVKGPDPTYEEWAAAHGLPTEEVPTG